MRRRVALGLAVTLVVFSACSGSDTTPAATISVDPNAAVVARPNVVAPGATFDVTFATATSRSAPWFMYEADGDSYRADPAFLVVSANGRTAPYWHPADEGGWDDYGIDGIGPDTLVVPTVARPGRYQLCLESDPDLCVEIIVEA